MQRENLIAEENEFEENETEGEVIQVEKVTFTTEDGFKISGNFSKKEKDAVLMMHILNSNKSAYDHFAQKLNDANYTTLAIDLRGHGESLDQNGVKRRWDSFSDQDFRDMVIDAFAAKRFLEQNGFKLKYVVGASIGANTALNFSAEEPSIKKIVLLSPGLEYKGITTQDSAKITGAEVLIVASDEDAYSFGSSKNLDTLIANSEFIGLRNAGHGTMMLSGNQLEKQIIEWFKQ
ncbi:MAG TPA: alpha/beta fold hydrolase [archaeon]|nr:alpha/beta fold hydrolase [archaeon]